MYVEVGIVCIEIIRNIVCSFLNQVGTYEENKQIFAIAS